MTRKSGVHLRIRLQGREQLQFSNSLKKHTSKQFRSGLNDKIHRRNPCESFGGIGNIHSARWEEGLAYLIAFLSFKRQQQGNRAGLICGKMVVFHIHLLKTKEMM